MDTPGLTGQFVIRMAWIS